MTKLISRRTLLCSAVASATIQSFPGYVPGAVAQTTSWVAAFAKRLGEIEQSAGAAGLPKTARTRAGAAQLNDTNVYLEGLPRLVDLIDRSETANSEIASTAGELLSELNSRERFAKAEFPRRPGSRATPKPTMAALRDEYLKRFNECKTRPEYLGAVTWHLQTIQRNKVRYEKLAGRVGIPWYFIAVIHGLEASFNFLGHLHNGDYLTQRTRNVPRGRPVEWLPPSDWESSAVDALTYEKFVDQKDWDLVTILYRWELYNGFGYRSRNVPSPYLWSFSNQHTSGKFVSDGRFDASAKSKQCGAAVMLKGLSNAGFIKL